jgi:HlyD family secretion protein
MKLFRSAQPAQLEFASAREVRIFQSETAEILEAPVPIQAHMVLLVLTGMLLSILLVSMVFRIDRVVTSIDETPTTAGLSTPRGKLVTIEPTIVLGAFDSSIIKSIDVRQGQIVTKGELLATLDPTFTKADAGALRAQVASLDAEIARCQAELAQKPFNMPLGTDPIANSYISAQREYYVQRKAQFDAQVNSYNAQVAQYKATIVKYQNDEARYGDRAKIAQEVEQMRAMLAAAQVGSKLNLLMATDQKVEVQRALEFDQNAVIESQRQLDATIQTRDAFIQQWNGQTSQELVTAQTNRDPAAEQLTKANKHEELVRIEAPEDSMVLQIAKLSPLSVLNQGDPLFNLAPLRSPLEAEIYIAARYVGFIRVGDDTTIKLDPFNFVEHGTIAGKVKSISEGTFTADDNGAATDPYYKVRVALEPVTLHNVPPSFRLVPGMTLEGDIHVGTRSLFMYLISGVVQGTDEAMREPE